MSADGFSLDSEGVTRLLLENLESMVIPDMSSQRDNRIPFHERLDRERSQTWKGKLPSKERSRTRNRPMLVQ